MIVIPDVSAAIEILLKKKTNLASVLKRLIGLYRQIYLYLK